MQVYRCRSSQVYEPPSRYRFTIVRATLPNFGVTMALCLAEAGSPRFLFGDPAKSTSPRKRRRRRGNVALESRERENSSSTKEEGFRYGLPRCLHWHAINGLRNSHEARYGPTKGRNSIRGPIFRQEPSLFRASCRNPSFIN